MKSTNLKLLVLLFSSLALSACGKTMVGTKVQKGGIGKSLPTDSKVIPRQKVLEGGCLSLPKIVSEIKKSDKANEIAMINTWQLELGVGKLQKFQPIDSKANQDLRAKLLLTKQNLINITTTIGEIANQKVLADLFDDGTQQSGCKELSFGNVKVDISQTANDQTLSFEDPTRPGIAKTYEYRNGGLLITTYTDLNPADTTICGNKQNLVLKQSLLIQMGNDISGVQVAASLWKLLRDNLEKPNFLSENVKPTAPQPRNDSKPFANSFGLPATGTIAANSSQPSQIGGTPAAPPQRPVPPPARSRVLPNQDQPAKTTIGNTATASQSAVAATSVSPLAWVSIVNAFNDGSVKLKALSCQN